jgi:hypothetical protein
MMIFDHTHTSVSFIPRLALSSMEVTLHGQIMTLVQDGSSWIGNGAYEAFYVQGKEGPVWKKSTLIEIPASIAQPVKGSLVKRRDTAIHDWKFTSEDLLTLADVLWDQVKINIKSIPARAPTKTFPCRDQSGAGHISLLNRCNNC